MRDRVLVSGNTTTSTTCSIGHSNSSGTNFIGTNSSSSNMIGTSSSTALAAARVMDRPSAQPHQAALKCPRCDSTNTKFCYYNNYSLSQPRHFCKACKRYWTRGGTLRNVPVGGGCRKNKRVRKPPLPTTTGKVSPHDPQLPRSSLAPLESLSSSNADISVFYSMPTLPNAIHFPSCTTAFALQPQVSALGAGVSSNQHDDDEYHLGLLLQQLPLMNDSQLFGSSLPPASAASLMASSLQHPKKIEGTRSLLTHEGLQDLGNFGVIKEVNIEGENTGINSGDAQWQLPPGNSLETFGSAAIKVSPGDSSYMYLKGAAGWPDAGSRWSSAAHLI